MAEAIQKPQDVPELARSMADDVWAMAHGEWLEDDMFFKGRYANKIVVPEWSEGRKFIPATAYAKVVNAVSQLITSEPRADRHAFSDEPKDQAEANRLSTWAGNSLKGFTRFTTGSPLKDFGHNLFEYGYSAMYAPTWNNALWPDFPERNKRRSDNKAWLREKEGWERDVATIFPFNALVPHPTEILIDPTAPAVPPWAIYRTQRTSQSLKDTFLDGSDNPDAVLKAFHHLLPGKSTEKVSLYIYWSEERYVVVGDLNTVDGSIFGNSIVLVDTDNPYGFMPFIHAFAGFGSPSPYGRSQDWVSDMAYGILRPIRSALLSEAQIATGEDQIVFKIAFEHLFVEERAKEIGDQMGQGIVVEIGVNNKVVPEQTSQIPPALFALKADRVKDTEIGSGGQSAITRGDRSPGTRTASQHAQQVSLAKQIYNTPMQRLNHVASIMVGNMARLMVVMEAPVSITGEIEGKTSLITVKPEDFKGHFHFDVDMEAADDIQRSIDLQRGLELRNMMGPDGLPGGISWEYFMTKFVHVENLEQIKAQLDRESILKRAKASPEYQMMVMQLAAQKAGIQLPVPEGTPTGG